MGSDKLGTIECHRCSGLTLGGLLKLYKEFHSPCFVCDDLPIAKYQQGLATPSVSMNVLEMED